MPQHCWGISDIELSLESYQAATISNDPLGKALRLRTHAHKPKSPVPNRGNAAGKGVGEVGVPLRILCMQASSGEVGLPPVPVHPSPNSIPPSTVALATVVAVHPLSDVTPGASMSRTTQGVHWEALPEQIASSKVVPAGTEPQLIKPVPTLGLPLLPFVAAVPQLAVLLHVSLDVNVAKGLNALPVNEKEAVPAVKSTVPLQDLVEAIGGFGGLGPLSVKSV
jgi:hypothetical protein